MSAESEELREQKVFRYVCPHGKTELAFANQYDYESWEIASDLLLARGGIIECTTAMVTQNDKWFCEECQGDI